MAGLRWRLLFTAAAGALICALAVPVAAQFGGGQRGFGFVTKARPQDFDGLFHFCRIAFANDFRGDADGNWSVDFPRADINISIRLAELTKTPVSMAAGEPRPLLVQMTDPEMFRCPFVMMTEVGSASISEPEAARLRDYLLKGGFLWADDFWGSYAWDWWAAQMGKVLPPSEYPWVDLGPGHPLYHAQFDVPHTPQIASINFWSGSGGSTSERGTDSAVVHTRAMLDARGRIMVLATHNTDLGDSFEREGDDPTYFYNFSVPGYAFGINTLLYAMTH